MKRRLFAVVLLIIAGWIGYDQAMSRLHIGAPDFYAGWNCPPHTFLKTYWVAAPDCNPAYVIYCYRGYQDLGGCASSLTIGTP